MLGNKEGHGLLLHNAIVSSVSCLISFYEVT